MIRRRSLLCYGTTITSNIADWTALANEQDEVDSLIICVIVWVVRLQRVNNNLNLTVRILSPDANFLYLHGTVLYSQHRRVQHHVRVLKQQVQEGNLSCYWDPTVTEFRTSTGTGTGSTRQSGTGTGTRLCNRYHNRC